MPKLDVVIDNDRKKEGSTSGKIDLHNHFNSSIPAAERVPLVFKDPKLLDKVNKDEQDEYSP